MNTTYRHEKVNTTYRHTQKLNATYRHKKQNTTYRHTQKLNATYRHKKQNTTYRHEKVNTTYRHRNINNTYRHRKVNTTYRHQRLNTIYRHQKLNTTYTHNFHASQKSKQQQKSIKKLWLQEVKSDTLFLIICDEEEKKTPKHTHKEERKKDLTCRKEMTKLTKRCNGYVTYNMPQYITPDEKQNPQHNKMTVLTNTHQMMTWIN